MAKVKLLIGSPVYDPDHPFQNAVVHGDVAPPTASKIVTEASDGSRIVLRGNFDVEGGDVVGGRMKSFEVYIDKTKVAVGSDYKIDAEGLFDALEANDLDAFAELLFNRPTKTVGSERGDDIGGGDFRDQILGRAGDDWLSGGGGGDTVNGGKGNDGLTGDGGHDLLIGGRGADIFHFFFGSLAPSDSADKIKDFKHGQDLIGLIDHDGALPSGYLQKKYFHKGSHAEDGNDVVIYNKKNGKIFFDHNGDDAGGKFLLAKVKPGTKLEAHDFFVDSPLLS